MGNNIKRIIVEGADQQGKSTMCKYLSKRLECHVIHYGPPKQGFHFHYGYMTPAYTISDRNYLSEEAYSRMQGRKSRVIEKDLLEDTFRDDTLFILLDREDDYVFEQREERYSQFQISNVREIYRDIFSDLDMKKIIVNPHHRNKEFDAIIKRLRW